MSKRKIESHCITLENNIKISVDFKESLEIHNRKKNMVHYDLYVNDKKVRGGFDYRFEAIIVFAKAIHNYQLIK